MILLSLTLNTWSTDTRVIIPRLEHHYVCQCLNMQHISGNSITVKLRGENMLNADLFLQSVLVVSSKLWNRESDELLQEWRWNRQRLPAKIDTKRICSFIIARSVVDWAIREKPCCFFRVIRESSEACPFGYVTLWYVTLWVRGVTVSKRLELSPRKIFMVT